MCMHAKKSSNIFRERWCWLWMSIELYTLCINMYSTHYSLKTPPKNGLAPLVTMLLSTQFTQLKGIFSKNEFYSAFVSYFVCRCMWEHIVCIFNVRLCRFASVDDVRDCVLTLASLITHNCAHTYIYDSTCSEWQCFVTYNKQLRLLMLCHDCSVMQLCTCKFRLILVLV